MTHGKYRIVIYLENTPIHYQFDGSKDWYVGSDHITSSNYYHQLVVL